MNKFEKFMDIAWLPLDVEFTDEDISLLASDLEAVPEEDWYWCTFREVYLLLLYGNETNIDNKKVMTWTHSADHTPNFKRILEEKFMHIFDVEPRIIIIRTKPGWESRLHVDCAANELDTFQPKLRIIAKGRVDTLYFYNEAGEKIYIPKTYSTYFMTGSVVHGIKNLGDTDKFTICFGNPWLGDDNPHFYELMERSLEKYKDEVITISSLGSVDHEAYVKDVTKEKLLPKNPYEE